LQIQQQSKLRKPAGLDSSEAIALALFSQNRSMNSLLFPNRRVSEIVFEFFQNKIFQTNFVWIFKNGIFQTDFYFTNQPLGLMPCLSTLFKKYGHALPLQLHRPIQAVLYGK